MIQVFKAKVNNNRFSKFTLNSLPAVAMLSGTNENNINNAVDRLLEIAIEQSYYAFLIVDCKTATQMFDNLDEVLNKHGNNSCFFVVDCASFTINKNFFGILNEIAGEHKARFLLFNCKSSKFNSRQTIGHFDYLVNTNLFAEDDNLFLSFNSLVS